MVNKIEEEKKQTIPIFQEIGRRIDAVKQRAFDLFQRRGHTDGYALEDWVQAEHEILGWPAAELTEKDDAYEVHVTLPGFDAPEIEVTTTPSELVIHAATQHEKKGKEKGVVWTEFGSNDVYRHFELPSKIQVEKVVANLDKGILRITAPLAGRVASSAA
jgi:HSP20 family molecular chaperone IbpA